MHTKSSDLIAMTIGTIAAHLRHQLRVLQPAAESVTGDLQLVEVIVQTFDAAVAKIETDAGLSAIGKMDQTREAGRTAWAALDAFEQKKVGGLDTRIAGVRAAIMKAIAPQLPTDPAVTAMRDARRSEIWHEVADLDAIQLTGLYLHASDEERAALEALPRRVLVPPDGGLPRWVDRLDASLVDSTVSARAAQTSPELAAELHDLNTIREAYAGLVGTARQSLREGVPSLGVDDRIAALAAGK